MFVQLFFYLKVISFLILEGRFCFWVYAQNGVVEKFRLPERNFCLFFKRQFPFFIKNKVI